MSNSTDEENQFKKEIRKYESISKSISYFIIILGILAMSVFLASIIFGVGKTKADIGKEMGLMK